MVDYTGPITLCFTVLWSLLQMFFTGLLYCLLSNYLCPFLLACTVPLLFQDFLGLHWSLLQDIFTGATLMLLRCFYWSNTFVVYCRCFCCFGCFCCLVFFCWSSKWVLLLLQKLLTLMTGLRPSVFVVAEGRGPFGAIRAKALFVYQPFGLGIICNPKGFGEST